MSDLSQRQSAAPPLELGAAAEDSARVSQLRGHPAFPRAMAQAAESLVGAYDGNRLLNRILNDRERSLFALMALYLHETPEDGLRGLTAGRIIALCKELDLCSRGRAKAMLVLMRWAGYLEPSQDPADLSDRRQRPLVPTALFLSMQTERWRKQYEAISLLDPAGPAALVRLEDPVFRAGLMRALVARFRAGVRVLNYAPALRLFAARDGGMMIAFFLLLSGARDDSFPPQAVLSVPVAALGRRFHVSRAHVLKLLRDAETAGLVERSANGVRLLPPLREALADFFAAAFMMLADSAHDVLAKDRGTSGNGDVVAPAFPLPGATPHPPPP